MFWSGLLAAALAVLVALGSVVWMVRRYQDATDYPASRLVYKDDTVKLWPRVSVRNVSSYEIADPFRAVYKWYSMRFGLGPEAYALSNCIQMWKSFDELDLYEQQTTVTVCDTSSGRMVSVTRTLTLLIPR